MRIYNSGYQANCIKCRPISPLKYLKKCSAGPKTDPMPEYMYTYKSLLCYLIISMLSGQS